MRGDVEFGFAIFALLNSQKTKLQPTVSLNFEPGTLNFRARYGCRWTLKNATP